VALASDSQFLVLEEGYRWWGRFFKFDRYLHVVFIEGNQLQYLVLRHASKIQSSVEGPSPEKNLKSKKNSLSYQVKKGAESKSRPFLSCAACGMFETPAFHAFMWCSRCQMKAYCSQNSQGKHWSKSGGNHKAVCAPPATQHQPLLSCAACGIFEALGVISFL